ncbi:hypothetical protein IWQ60_001982 [Tieghemiomyces parasiticus]|uniref:DUF7492 domain-containing protein n=1 Tax=Tieghemiomyces parasiticus TaxID=78921 RepID=A0A9W8AD45_9FUNG|nr:hypothetical protein IWQ60_001982 [Tieghemiomyces parasiticus]
MRSFLLTAAALATLALPQLASAHTWADCIDWDPVKRQCNGYPRGYPGREDVNINTDYTYLFSGTPSSQPMCRPGRQDTANYSAKYPQGVAQAGKTYNVRYEINGHQAYATSKVKVLYFPDENIDTLDYNKRSSAKVVGEWNFITDGQCDLPLTNNTSCYGSYTLPDDLPSGDIQLVYFWEFNANPAGQQYSTCFDLKNGGAMERPSASATVSPVTSGVAAPVATGTSTDVTPSANVPTATGNASEVVGTTTPRKCRRKCRGQCSGSSSPLAAAPTSPVM